MWLPFCRRHFKNFQMHFLERHFDNKPALVWVVAWHRIGIKPLAE